MIVTPEGHDDRMAAYLRRGRRLHGQAVCQGLRRLGRVLLRSVSRPKLHARMSHKVAA